MRNTPLPDATQSGEAGAGETAAAAESAAVPEPRYSLRRALLLAALSRLVFFAVAPLATYLLGIRPASWALRYPRRAEVFHGVLGHVLNPWAHWDGVWFIKIAVNGYAGNDGSVAFFPLFPLLLRWTGVLFGNNLVVTGIVVSTAFYLVAMALLYRLVAADFSPRIAWWTVIFLSIFPTSFFFQAVYSESLFLMLSLLCFRWSRQGRWKLAGLAGLLATLTRSTGVLLVIPMALFYYRQRGWSLRRTDAGIASLLMIPEGLMVWMAYLSLGFHRPLLFAQVQDQWRRTFAPPDYALWRGALAAFQGMRQIVSRQDTHLFWPAPNPGAAVPLAIANIVSLAVVVLIGWALYLILRRVPLPYSAYAVAMVAFPLFFPSRVQPLMSMPRFVLAAFPAFIGFALLAERRPRARWVLVAAFVAGGVLLTVKFAVFSWVA
jgi:hypothetical protein